MSTKLLTFFAVLALAAVSAGNAAYGQRCPEPHCNGITGALEQCRSEKRENLLIYDRANKTSCTCPCSCYASRTAISTQSGERFVEEIKEGDVVETPNGSSRVVRVMTSAVENEAGVSFELSNGRRMLVSANHPLVVSGGVVKAAATITTGDALLDVRGQPVVVVKAAPQDYSGTFYNMILEGLAPSGEDRIVISEGIQSGDWMVQSFRDQMNANLELREVISKIANDR